MRILVIGMCGNSLFYNKETNMLLNEEPGGKGYNQAVGIAKLGGNVSFLGAIGNDCHGTICGDYLNNIGVNNLLIRKNTKTTYATIHVDAFGNNDINVVLGAKLEFSDLDYIKTQIDNHDLIMLQNEIDVDINIELLKYAYDNHKYILVNPAPYAKWMEDYLDLINLITPNEHEARVLFSIPDSVLTMEIGKYLSNLKCNNVLVTLGDKGSVFIQKDKYQYFPSLKVKAVDTTGAGDLMNACLAYGIQKGFSFSKSIDLGTKACAYSVSRRYVLDSYPTINDLD